MILENEAYWRSRNYASTNHPNASIRPKLVITYSVSSDPVASRLDYIFARLDKAQVPSGFLEEYGAEIVPMDTYNGVLSDSNRFDLTTWRMAYASYQSSRIHGTNPLPGISSINQQISNLQSSGVNPVMVAYGDYGIMKENAVTDNLLRMKMTNW
jgi:hypothetical protein